MAEFSVITIVKGRRRQLTDLLASIAAATLQPKDIQIACMDDPADITVPSHMNVMLHTVPNKDMLPLAAARNTGIAAARTDTCIFIDVDCIVSPTLFAAMLDRLTEHTVVTAYPLYLRTLPDRADFTRLRPMALSHPARRSIPAGVAVAPDQFWSLIFAIRKPAFYKVGGFDDSFTGYGAEDTDFATAFDKAGLKLYFVRDYVLHQYHAKYDPPLDHFAAIIQNARTYQAKWGTYPMQHWLRGFAAAGLIVFNQAEGISVIRHPSAAEVSASLSGNPY